MCGIALTRHGLVSAMPNMHNSRPSLTMQVTTGMDVFAHVCGQKADTSSNYYDNIQPYDKRRFGFCQMWHDSYIVFFGNYHKFELLNFAR